MAERYSDSKIILAMYKSVLLLEYLFVSMKQRVKCLFLQTHLHFHLIIII